MTVRGNNNKHLEELSTKVIEDRLCANGFTGGMQPVQLSKYFSSVADVKPRTRPGRSHRIIAKAYDLGSLHFVSAVFDAMSLVRTKNHLKTLNADHWILIHLKSGRLRCQSGKKEFEAGPGSLNLLSLADEISIDLSRCRCSMMWLSRDIFVEMFDILDSAANSSVSGALTDVLSQFMSALEQHISSATHSEIPMITTSLEALLKSSLTLPTHPHKQKQVINPVTVLECARRYIHQNLRSPELGPDQICKALNISRRTLCYYFENRGGVANYIRRKRLLACHEALSNSTDHRLVSTIAYDYGFTNAAQFTRNFTAYFGYSPKEARRKLGFGFRPIGNKRDSFLEWLRA